MAKIAEFFVRVSNNLPMLDSPPIALKYTEVFNPENTYWFYIL